MFKKMSFCSSDVLEVTYTSNIFPQIIMREIKCTSVYELSHIVANDCVNKTTGNWQGKVNFHYFLKEIYHSILG